MTLQATSISRLLPFWNQHREQYNPPIYGLILCGNDTSLDTYVYEFCRRHAMMLDDMSGPYASISFVTDWERHAHALEGGESSGRHSAKELGYFHSAAAWTFGDRGVYSLTQALQVPLEALPVLLLCSNPWSSEDALALSLRDVHDAAPEGNEVDEYVARFFASIFTACRQSASMNPSKRLKKIKKHIRVDSGFGITDRLEGISKLGIIEQVVAGVVKGLS